MERLINSDDSADEVIEEPVVAPGDATVPAEPVRVVHTRSAPGFLRAIILGLIAIIIVVLLVLFARWIYHVSHHNNVPTVPANGKKIPSQPSGTLKVNNQTATNNQTGNKNQSNNSSSSNSRSSNNNLPNNGPGNVAVIFAGTTTAAAGLHYIISLRKFNKS